MNKLTSIRKIRDRNADRRNLPSIDRLLQEEATTEGDFCEEYVKELGLEKRGEEGF